ncbi:Hypothetical protein, putative, partial [Bodo saltans]
FLSTLLRTSPMSWRKETVRKLLKKWHLHERRGPAGEEPDVTLMYDLVALTVRAGLADDEARRADSQKNHSARRSSGYAQSLAVADNSLVKRAVSDLHKIPSITPSCDEIQVKSIGDSYA